MSIKEINFDKLELSKKLKVKKVDTSLDAEKAVQSIHDQKPEKERTKRITIDLPFSLYVDIRNKTVVKEKTLKDYFIDLVRSDLQGR